MKRLLVSLFILAVIILFAWLMMQDKSTKSYTYTDFGARVPENFQLLGIDISHHQGEINWPQVGTMSVDGDSIGFVYIKTTEGITHVDDRWEENAAGALQENIPFGLYHFMLTNVSAAQQANVFAEKCLQADDTLRPMLDIEEAAGYSAKRLRDSVYVFITTFEKKMKMRPVIYTYESFFNDYFKASYLKNEYFWIANYNGECEAAAAENVIVWQFSESGTVNGIGTNVDLNVARESFNEVMFQD